MTPKAPIDTDHSLQPVPDSARRGFWSMLAVMTGFTFFSASMWTGGKLGVGLTAGNFLLAVLGGNLVLGIYTGALAFIASKTHLSTHLLARYSFGERGSWLPSFLLGITQVGWFGVGVAMFALPVHKVLAGHAGLTVALPVLVFLGGALMTATAWFGMRALTLLSVVAVPAIATLGSLSVGKALTDAGGIDKLLQLRPEEPIALSLGVSLCVASFISGGTLTADFIRFARNTRVALSTTFLAFFLGNSLMFVFGAVGAATYHRADISEVMLLQGFIFPAMLVLGLNLWTTNDNALYASGLAFANITGWPKKTLVLVNGAAGTLGALYLYEHFVQWLQLLNTLLPPLGAVIIADYFLVRRGAYEPLGHTRVVRINPAAVAAWLAGVLAAQFLPGVAPLNSVLVAGAVYPLLTRLHARHKPAANDSAPD